MPRARRYDGVVYRRAGKESWWIRYRDRKGIARRESSQTADWDEASKKLRERLLARDANLLEVVRKGETLTYGQWADSFLENYSKPPMRAEKTHSCTVRAHCARITERSGGRDFLKSFAIRKKVVDVAG